MTAIKTDLILNAIHKGFDDVNKKIADTNKLLGQTKKKSEQSSKSTSMLGQAFGVLGGAIAALGLGMVIKKLGDFTWEATLLAARVETLGVVTQSLGRNAGYTRKEIIELERAIQKQGITVQASRQSLARMMQANIDLAYSTDLARLAQDAAVIAGINSSEAFQRLIMVITSGNVLMARRMGLQVNFNKGYQELAARLGISTEALTANEKAQERANIVMKEGEQIAGTYEAAMGTVGKQLESTARYWEEFKRAFGEGQVETVGEVNTAWQRLLKTETDRIDTRHRLAEAVAYGIYTEEESLALTKQLVDKDIEYADVLATIIELLDQRANALEVESHLDKKGILTKAELTEATRGLFSATQELGEKELIVARNEAIIAGNFALAAHYNNLLTPILAANAAYAIQIGLLDAIAARGGLVVGGGGLGGIVDESTRGGGGGGTQTYGGLSYSNSYWQGNNLMRDGEIILTKQAQGGWLGSGVSIVGEEGYEIVTPDGYVIPHDQSKKLLEAGLIPGQELALGGYYGDVEFPSDYSEAYGVGIGSGGRTPKSSDRSLYSSFLYSTVGAGGSSSASAAAVVNVVAETVVQLTAAVQTSTVAMAQQSQLAAQKIVNELTSRIERSNNEVSSLLRTQNSLLARLATASDIIGGMSSAVGDLL